MSGAHTSGPWEREGHVIKALHRGIIATCPTVSDGGTFDAHHNARLIAAAPELLEALEEAVATIWQYKDDLHHPPSDDSFGRRLERASEVASKAMRAIALAKGGAA